MLMKPQHLLHYFCFIRSSLLQLNSLLSNNGAWSKVIGFRLFDFAIGNFVCDRGSKLRADWNVVFVSLK
jgi:hypothetical protein